MARLTSTSRQSVIDIKPAADHPIEESKRIIEKSTKSFKQDEKSEVIVIMPPPQPVVANQRRPIVIPPTPQLPINTQSTNQAQRASSTSRRLPVPKEHKEEKGRAVSTSKRLPSAPTKFTNYQQIKNSLTSVCLAGPNCDHQRLEAFCLMDYYHSGKESAVLETFRSDAAEEHIPPVY